MLQGRGGSERSEQDQMQVEESGNMLILVDALAPRAEEPPPCREVLDATHELSRIPEAKRTPILTISLRLMISTSHVAHNANLSIKLIIPWPPMLIRRGCFIITKPGQLHTVKKRRAWPRSKSKPAYKLLLIAQDHGVRNTTS